MKYRSLITICLSLFLVSSYAEDYPKVVEQGKTFVYYGADIWPYNKLEKKQIRFGKEEVIVEGVRYTPVYQIFENRINPAFRESILGYIREDTGKVYYYTPLSQISDKYQDVWNIMAYDRETVIYDFTIPAGGSYLIDIYDLPVDQDTDDFWHASYQRNELEVTLQSIENIIYGGQERRKYTYAADYNGIWSFIEGIGPERGTIIGPFLGSEKPEPVWNRITHLLAIYDSETGDISYDRHGLPTADEGGEDYKSILGEGLDFEYFKSGDKPESTVHYVIDGKVNIYGQEYFKVWRYEHGHRDKAELMAYMREAKGKVYMRTAFDAIKHFFSESLLFEVTVGEHVGDILVYDMNLTSEDNPEIAVDEVMINGEQRKKIAVNGKEIVEGLGVVRNGVLPFPGDDYSLAHGYEFRLNCIRDAEGNVIFSRDQLSGIDDVTTGEERQAETEYYDLTGRRVSVPGKGIYIVKDSAGVRKAVF